MIKSNKEVTLKTRETYFFIDTLENEKLQENIYEKFFSKNLLKVRTFLGKSHSAEKETKIGQLSQK